MRKIHVQALAKQDLKEIWLYSYNQWGEQQADKYFDELDYGIALIADNPEI
jgi:toxin ParE1/3/4